MFQQNMENQSNFQQMNPHEYLQGNIHPMMINNTGAQNNNPNPMRVQTEMKRP